MAKSAPRPANPVEDLLEERNRYQMWLARLDQAGSTAPAAVRDRIRDDYHRRLGEVIEQLRSHAAAVAEQLAALQARQAELRQREGEAQETLAEAELRHAVGEYDTGEWDRVRGENERVLLGVREDLSRVGEDIDRLLEVQELISAPPAPAPAPVPPPPRAATPASPPLAATAPPAPAPSEADNWEPEFPLAEPSETPPAKAPSVGAPKFTPRSGPAKGKELPPRTLPFPSKTPEPAADELAFLKSVSDEPAPPKRISGSTPRVTDPGIMPAEPPGVVPESGPQKIVIGGDRASQSATPKTLKCGECGALNRPTEWYCERCGAELAAL